MSVKNTEDIPCELVVDTIDSDKTTEMSVSEPESD